MRVKLLAALTAAALLSGAPSCPLQASAQSASQESPKQAEPQTPRRIRVGGQAMAARVTHKVTPNYPKDAKRQGIEGTVRLAALVGQDGSINDLKVVSGDPVLAKSAVDAVKKWRYKPTLLNGQPVEVETEIDVNFHL
jgi:periplasmic protein TonB